PAASGVRQRMSGPYAARASARSCRTVDGEMAAGDSELQQPRSARARRENLGGSRMSTVLKTPRSNVVAQSPGFDVERVRRDFPVLDQEVHAKPLVYLDNAATTQKPLAVIDAIENYYRRDNSNIHRGVHALSERATAEYENVRVMAQRFLNAADQKEI